jgi:proteasome lid subunit RPN8/RPN11
MIEALGLSAALCEQLKREAQVAFPRECCGLIEGVRCPLALISSKGEAIALHPMRNFAPDSDRFEIDTAAHIALLRSLRGTGRDIIGCYHSHPNGRPEPSARDIGGAGEQDFLWLITALASADAAPQMACFFWTGSAFAPVRIDFRPRSQQYLQPAHLDPVPPPPV